MTEDTAIVTGGASGIGRATCLRYAEEGYSVVVADLDEEPVEEGRPTHVRIEDDGGEAVFVQTDVRQWDDVQALVEQAAGRYGGIDVLVNNAGVASNGRIDEMPLEDAYNIFRTNIDGVYHGMRAIVPHMREQGSGAIVNISSGLGKHAAAELAAYSGSKFAVIGMTEAVAEEVRADGITVNAVCPGMTETAMTEFQGVPPETVAERIMEAGSAGYTGKAVDV